MDVLKMGSKAWSRRLHADPNPHPSEQSGAPRERSLANVRLARRGVGPADRRSLVGSGVSRLR